MAEGQEQRIIISPPVPGTPEYYSHQRQQRDLLPAEKRLGMIRDPDYRYTYKEKYKKSLYVSLCIYFIIFFILFYVLCSFSIPKLSKPITIELSFGDPQSEVLESIEVVSSGIENDVDKQKTGATDIKHHEPEPAPDQIVEEKNDSFENSFNQYVESMHQSSENAKNSSSEIPVSSENIESLSSSVGQAVSINHSNAAIYGSGDSMDNRLVKAGAQTGEIQISLFWNTADDIDLHVYYTPGNGLSDNINWTNRFGKLSRGILDVDMNANGPNTNKCVENVFWPYGSNPKGFFVVQAQFYRSWTGLRQLPIVIRVKIGNIIETFNGTVWLGASPVTITRFKY